MKVRWLGHASFLLTSESSGMHSVTTADPRGIPQPRRLPTLEGAGVRVLTDPYTTTDRILYAPPDEEADIVTVSHEHGDHNNVAAVRGAPEALHGLAILGGAPEATSTARGVEFKLVAAYHDDRSGGQRGGNAIFCFTLDGVRVCHLGDLGHLLDADQVARIGAVDVLLCPSGGGPTVNAAQAREVVAQLRPRIVIPMHVRNERCTFPTDDVEAFVTGQSRVRRVAGDAAFAAGQLPETTEVVVLKPTK